jgi:hypothetical protein
LRVLAVFRIRYYCFLAHYSSPEQLVRNEVYRGLTRWLAPVIPATPEVENGKIMV